MVEIKARRKPDIVDNVSYYSIRGSAIIKNAGTGKVLERLLAGDRLDVEKIIQVTGWKNPDRNMYGLMKQVNGWSGYFRIRRSGEGTKASYRMKGYP